MLEIGRGRLLWPVLALVAAFAIAIAPACGGDDDDSTGDSDGDVPGAAEETADDGDTDTEVSADEEESDEDSDTPSGDGPGSGRAIVTLGDDRIEFDMSMVCISMAGAVGGSGVTEDGAVHVSVDIPPEGWESSDEDWDAPTIRVEDDRDEATERDWRAGDSIFELDPDAYSDLEGNSQVDSFEVADSRVTGTATFIDFYQYQLAQAGAADMPEPVAGTFDVDCS